MATNEKKKKILDLKYLYFFGGIALCLVSIILIINVGYIARALAFVPFFAFGITSCALYFALYLIGLYILLKDKVFKFKFKTTVPGFIIFFVGLMITATISTSNLQIDGFNFTLTLKGTHIDESGVIFANAGDKFLEIFNTRIVDGYWNAKFLHMFNDSLFGGGYLGFLLTALLNDYVGVGMTQTIGILLMVFGGLLLLGPFLVTFFIKKYKENKTKTPTTTVPVKEEIKKPTPVKVAPVIHKEPIKTPTAPIVQPVIQETPVEPIKKPPVITTHALYEDDNYQLMGSFVPAHFSFATRGPEIGGINPTGESVLQPVGMHMRPKTVEPEQISGEEAIIENIKQETHIEQMTLEFEEEQPTVQPSSLGTKLPTFSEPVVVNKETTPEPSTIAIQAIPTPKTPKKKMKYIAPSVDLLNTYEIADAVEENTLVAEERLKIINETFEHFKVGAEVTGFTIGPAVTRFHVAYKPGVPVKSVANVVSNLCINLGGVNVRFEPMVAGERYSGLEVPNAVITTIGFKDTFIQLPEKKKKPFSVPFGKNISGQTIFGDYRDFPHMLVAGTTGSGKSVFVHSIITTLIMRNSPDELKIMLMDPKMVEMNKYNGMPHLLCPIIYEAKEAKVAFDKLCEDMDARYAKMREAGVSSIKEFNAIAESINEDEMPAILVVIDEYADLVEQCKEIQSPVTRISAKARACGIHLLVATQRPSVNVVTGVLKSNLPTHVALKTSNYTDSMTILNEGGAEKLLGKGDMLVQSTVFAGQGLIRIQSPFIQNDEIGEIVKYLKENYETEYDPKYLDLVDHSKENARQAMLNGTYGMLPEGVDESDPDENFYLAVKEWVMTLDYVSGSKIQRHFGTGYPRAIRMFRRLQDDGIVEDNDNPSSSKGCRVLVHDKFYGEDEDDNPALDEDNY